MYLEELCTLFNITLSITYSVKNQRWEADLDCFVHRDEKMYKPYTLKNAGLHGKNINECMTNTIKFLENKYIKLSQLGDDRTYKIPDFLQVKINNE